MYAFLEGRIEEIEADRIFLNCHGVGYEICTHSRVISQSEKGETARFYTQLVVREDALTLYGFFQKEEKQFFLRLLSVSGIGPKVAVSVLSAMTVQQAGIAILTGDDKALSGIPGIGKKTAQRLVLELKGSMDTQALIAPEGAKGFAASAPGSAEAMAILTAMGFAASDAAAALSLVNAEEHTTSEQLAMAALQKLDRMK